LEAFSLVSIGKSFQSTKGQELVRNDTPGLTVRAQVFDEDGIRSNIDVKRSGRETRIAVDGMELRSASELARRVPMLCVTSRVPEILAEGPQHRRALIDRTLFHVKPKYVDQWKAYRAALKNRNELLHRNARIEASYWHNRLADAAVWIDKERRAVLASINRALTTEAAGVLPVELHMDFSPGWDTKRSLLDVLDESWDRDRDVGYTVAGPHRCDMVLKKAQRPIARKLSRGQSKVAACVVVSGLLKWMTEELGNPPVLLVDDIAAELDDEAREAVVEIFLRCSGQSVFTAIRRTDLPEVVDSSSTLFHVKQAA
jgi:DNA replication and repair protein RecF